MLHYTTRDLADELCVDPADVARYCRVQGWARPLGRWRLGSDEADLVRAHFLERAGARATRTAQTCRVDGCEGVVLHRGYCRPHYRRLQRYGDPTAGAGRGAHQLTKTHCPHGHPYDDENTVVYDGRRRCRTCRRARCQ